MVVVDSGEDGCEENNIAAFVKGVAVPTWKNVGSQCSCSLKNWSYTDTDNPVNPVTLDY